MTQSITKEQYQQFLDKHDWWWFNSDSAQVRDIHYANEEKLKEIYTDNPEFQKMFDDKVMEVYGK